MHALADPGARLRNERGAYYAQIPAGHRIRGVIEVRRDGTRLRKAAAGV